MPSTPRPDAGNVPRDPSHGNADRRFDVVSELYRTATGSDATFTDLADDLEEVLDDQNPSKYVNVRAWFGLLKDEQRARNHYERLSR